MDLNRIKLLADKIKLARECLGAKLPLDRNYIQFDGFDSHTLKPIVLEAMKAALRAATPVYERRLPLLVASLEAELRGEICPQPEPDADAYLVPVTEALGPCKGLNADWACMAWPVAGNLNGGTWLLDDESPSETVSLVTRQDDGSGDPSITTICQGTVEQVLPIAKAIAVQVQHG